MPYGLPNRRWRAPETGEGASDSAVPAAAAKVMGRDRRVEMRFPDPSANPYFVGEHIAIFEECVIGLELADRLARRAAHRRHVPQLLRRQVIEVLVHGIAGMDLVRDAVEAGPRHGGEGDLLDSYIELKWDEIYDFEHTPHPVEFKRYYSV